MSSGLPRTKESWACSWAYCIDILTQVSAVNSALRNVALGLLDDHMKHCVRDAAELGGEEADAKFQEVTDAIARFARS